MTLNTVLMFIQSDMLMVYNLKIVILLCTCSSLMKNKFLFLFYIQLSKSKYPIRRRLNKWGHNDLK
jgi:hypothetical protein